jgi:hypothetical protein
MSRGLGSRQTHILDTLTRAAERRGVEGWVRMCGFLDEGGDDEYRPPTPGERETTRRALRRLEALELIEVRVLPRRCGWIPGAPMPTELQARLSVGLGPSNSNT